jgi:uncharacterized cupin superfamily protein
MESPIHRAMSIDYGVVIEGKFQLTLDSGEKKIMLPGDMSTFPRGLLFATFLRIAHTLTHYRRQPRLHAPVEEPG